MLQGRGLEGVQAHLLTRLDVDVGVTQNSWGPGQLLLLRLLSLYLHVVSLAWWPLSSQTLSMTALGSQGKCRKRAKTWQNLFYF